MARVESQLLEKLLTLLGKSLPMSRVALFLSKVFLDFPIEFYGCGNILSEILLKALLSISRQICKSWGCTPRKQRRQIFIHIVCYRDTHLRHTLLYIASPS